MESLRRAGGAPLDSMMVPAGATSSRGGDATGPFESRVACAEEKALTPPPLLRT
jgi:hypothetical protein